MKKFLLIVRADIEKLKNIKEGDRFKDWPDMVPWVKELTASGHRIDGSPLDITGKHVQKGRIVSDGPFIESKEGILGFDIILAEDLDHAVAIAATCPMVKQGVASREVREMRMDLLR